MTRLATLNLSFSAVTDSGLAHIASLSSLSSLSLDSRLLSDSGLAKLTGALGHGLHDLNR